MKLWTLCLLLVVSVFLPWQDVSAQLAVGGHVIVADLDTNDALWGFGARAVVGIPLTGIGAQATLDIRDGDCNSASCRNRVLGFDALYSFPIPVVLNPYVGGGVSVDADDDWEFDWDVGDMDWNVVAGVVLGGPAFPRYRPFLEGKYEIREGKTLFSGGILFHLF